MRNIKSGTQIFQKCRNHLKTLWTWIKFHTQDPQILGTTVQNLVTCMTWHLGFVHLPAIGILNRTQMYKQCQLINTTATK